jgi:deoxycytidylate deaminase
VSTKHHLKILNLLSKVAVTVEPVASARIAAAIVYKNDIISFGVNQRKSHPFHAQFRRNDESIFLHAETDAIKNALKFIDHETLSRSTLYICRMKYITTDKREFVFGLSKPCDGCMRAIATFDIKNVVYSLDDEGYGIL